jgi:hypothetical protein
MYLPIYKRINSHKTAEGTFDGLADWDTGGTIDTLFDYINT